MINLLTTKLEEKTIKKLLIGIFAVFLCIVFFASGLFIYDKITNKRPLFITHRCEELKGFVRVKEEGDTIPVGFPCKLKCTNKAGNFVFETTLPDKILDDTWIDYYCRKDTRIYIDGELRYEYDHKKNTVIGGNVKSIHIFVELAPEDAGKTLRIERVGNVKGKTFFREVYIGNSLGLVERIIHNEWVLFIFTMALLIFSPIAFFVGLFLRLFRKIDSPIEAIGLVTLFISLWLIFDSQIYQFIFHDYYIDGTMSFIVLFLIPYPFLYYLNKLQKNRYKQNYAYLLVIFAIASVIFMVLHFTGICSFVSLSPVIMLFIGLLLVCSGITLFFDAKAGEFKKYRFSFTGVVGFFVACFIEVIFLLTVENRHDGTFIVVGLYWMLILAIIQRLIELREAQKETAIAVRANETKSNFLANMSHEIRTPMNAILGMDEMILREAKGDEKILKYATDIKSAGNMLLAIINDILDLSKIESGKAELVETDFEICSVINDLINITRKRALDKGLGYFFDVDSNLPAKLHGDEIRVRQIMLNIMNNAVKYTKEGEVRINVTMQENEDKEKCTIVVSVKDTGIGIKEEDKQFLFQSFARLEETKNRNIEGTGLGLNIANSYISMMGGRIEVNSVYNEGSEFILYIPLKVIDSSPIGDFSEAIKRMNEEREDYRTIIMAPSAHVLVVDDNEMNLEVICGLMESTKIKVDVALSGPEGISKMNNVRYDLIFLDQMMPGMDGVTTFENMKAKYDMRGVSVIALTADAVGGAKEYYLEKGFDGYLSKPVRAEDLERALIKYLPKNLLLSEEDIARIASKDEERKLNRNDLTSVLVVDSDSEALKNVKSEIGDTYKGTFVTDMDKARKYMEKHDVSYVMIRKDLFEKEIKDISELINKD